MRIGVDCQAFGAGVRHGFTTYLGNLLRALRRRYPESEFLEWPCQYHAGWRIPHQLWWDQGRVPWRAFRKHVDLIHSPAFSGPLVRTQPLVLTVHDLLYARHPEWLPTKRARWYWAEWIPFTARHASAVIVPSEATKTDLIAIAGLSAHQIAVIPHAIDPLFARRPSAEAVKASRAQRGLHNPYILYVGAIDRRKDWKGLLTAFSQIRIRYPAVQLVIAGYMNRQRSNLTEVIEELGDQSGIVLTGHIPDQELPLLYAGAELFVYPSRWEGFGLPPLEAMAMGIPVITYHSSSLPEVVGDAGILLDAPYAPERLAEQMERLMADRPFRCQIVARGLQHVQAFSWDRAAEQTMAVYARCV